MDRIWKSGASGTPPAVPAVPSTGFPTQGNPVAGVPPTTPGAYWFHMVTESLRNIIVEAGLTPDASDLTLVVEAIKKLALMSGEIGKISFVPASTPSPGHIPVFGTEVSRGGAYADLWDYAQTYGVIVDEATHATRPGAFSYGPGGVGGSTFRVPKINGLVIKAYHNGDGTYTTDVASLIGQYIPDQVLQHSHGVPFGTSEGDNTSNATNGGGTAGNFSTTSVGGSENLVRSVILFPQMRYML